MLQSHGEEGGPAWPIVLALLKGVAQDEEEHHVRQAFMCVQLVRNDLLSVLPVDCLQLLLTTIGSFGYQGCDLNISLTAITLLMNIADFFRYAFAYQNALQKEVKESCNTQKRPTDNTLLQPGETCPAISIFRSWLPSWLLCIRRQRRLHCRCTFFRGAIVARRARESLQGA